MPVKVKVGSLRKGKNSQTSSMVPIPDAVS